jgi:hypothetical protein
MRPTRSRCPRTSAADSDGRSGGFTLIELVITCTLLLLVIGVILGALDQVMKTEAYTADRTDSLDAMRVTLNRMTREIRQASNVNEVTSTPSRIEFDTYISGGTRHVTYDATGTDLTRQLGTGTPSKVLGGLESTDLFTYVDAPPVPGAQWVRISLQVRPAHTPDTVLILDSEINLRNRTGALT